MSAGRIIGRTDCPVRCGNTAAHVKQAEGKLPYVYCPDCGCTLPTRNGNQAAALKAITRPDKLATLAPGPDGVHEPPKPAEPPAPAAPAAANPAPPTKPKRVSSWVPLL